MGKFRFYSIKLSLIIIAVFLLQIIFSSFTDFFLLNSESFFQPWRFVTSIFLHGGLSHIIFNLFALILFGSILESLIGGKKFLIVFFVTGIIANLIAVNFYPSSLGASGAIFGVIGALVVIRPLLVVWAFGLPMPIFLAGILWVVGDLIGLFVPSNVGNIAHLSGMFFGLILGLVYRKKIPRAIVSKPKMDEGTARRWEDSYFNLKKL